MPGDDPSRGWLRSIYHWLTKTPSAAPDTKDSGVGDRMPARVGHYALERKLGQGGMGVVYAARDEHLRRPVALKMIASRTYDEAARRRFWREARAAASVSHPHVCQIHEIGEDQGHLFIAMELLEGEPLDRRIGRGTLSVSETTSVGLEVLDALSALHERGVVHRDLKPSNVFLTRHGVKLLDFGLAQPEIEAGASVEERLTRTGMVVGTPHYMAPECVLGDPVGPWSDLFAVGAILFEMLAGRPAFGGRTVAEIIHATVYEQPPALAGPSAVTAVDRIIRRALSKRASERPASARAMADDLRTIRQTDGDVRPAVARALTRVVVLPFRVLRPEPESDFLAFSLPDAIATSLSRNGSLVVRSSAVAARFAGERPDLKALAVEVDVDRVVLGTLLRSGDEVRASVQLVEAPAGTLLASHTTQSPFGDLFRLQDDIARHIVEALSLPLAGPAPSTPDAPRDARAYELYLRANQLARTYDRVPEARELYEQCLALDPAFAPAWAHLGRCLRVMAKYIGGVADGESLAERAFRRALEINPRLTVAHKYYAQLEADVGKASHALERLLGEARRHRNDSELFAGLVHACRYCGLYEESLAAHVEAHRLDPKLPTGFEETLLMAGQLEPLLAVEGGEFLTNGNRVIGLGLGGRREEARDALAGLRRISDSPVLQAWCDYLAAWLDRRIDEMVFEPPGSVPLSIMNDPEAIFQAGWLLCDAGAYDRGLTQLQRAVAGGYLAAPTLRRSPQFDPLRTSPVFKMVLAAAEAGREAALETFRAAGGDRLLGVSAAPQSSTA